MDTLNYVKLIKTLLEKKGIQERNFASTIANILGIKYISAKQKIDCKRGIKLNELKKVYEYFNESLQQEKSHNAIFIDGDGTKRCNIEAKKIDIFNSTNKMLASKLDDLYIIDMSIKHLTHEDNLFEVISINFLPPPVVAILDNDEEVNKLLSATLSKNGIQTSEFTSSDEIKKEIDSIKFDAFIIDWLLDYGETSDSVIQKIRKLYGNSIPIIILTGQINQHESGISEMILHHNVKIMEKPTKPKILIAFLEAAIFYLSV